MRLGRGVLSGLLAAVWAAAAAHAAATPSSFAPPDVQSAKELKRAVGKPFSAGYVFVDGRYLPPPYKVERYGTVIRVNDVQVTGEIVAWDQFLKTQSGVEVSKTVTGGDEAAAPTAAGDDLFDDAPAAEPEPEPEPEDDDLFDDDDEGSSLDDLFDDNPAPKPKKAAPKKKKIPPKPKVRRPTVSVSYKLNGPFVHNEKTRAYLKKIDSERARIDRGLRTGGYFCFGSRYGSVYGDARQCRLLLGKLPEIMRDNSDPTAFNAAMRQAGFTYYPPALVQDFARNRFGYLQLLQRRKAEREAKEWQALGL